MNLQQPASELRFCVAHLLYLFALLSASLATFGSIGLMLAVLILGAWWYVFLSHDRRRAFFNCLKLSPAGLFLLCAIGSTISVAPGGALAAARRMHCLNNLKQISLALENYHVVHGSFPPAYLTDEQGAPSLSWRALVWPYLDKPGEFLDPSVPWNHPRLEALANQAPAALQCVEDLHARPGDTSYFAVIGPNAAWWGAESRAGADFSDPKATILLVESHGRGVNWLEPRDLTAEEARQALSQFEPRSSSGHHIRGFFYDQIGGHNVVTANGDAKYFSLSVSPDETAAVLRVVKDKDIEFEWPDRRGRRRRVNWGNLWRLMALIAVTLFPTPWVFRFQESEARSVL